MKYKIARDIINGAPVNNKELTITIDNPPITLNYDYDDLNNDIDPDFEDIYTGFCPIEINVPIPNFIKKWEYLPLVEYEIEDPITHETHTGETFTLYDQPISSNGKFKIVKWNNIPDNPFYDGLLGEGLVLRKITETEQTTDRDWDVHINVQPSLYALNLGTMSTNTNGVITRTPQEFGYDYYGFSSVSYEINIKNGELNIGTIRANTNNTPITLLPSSYNWQYFNKVKYIVDVPQGITTNLFNTIRSNNTYSLAQLYTGNDNPVAFKPDSQITIQVDPPVLSVGPLNLGSLTDNTTQTITIDPNDYHYDYFNQVSYSVNVPKPITTTFNTIIANTTQNYTLNDLYIGQGNPIGFKPDSVIPVLVDHHLISNDTFTITSNNQTYTIEQLMQLNQYSPSSYNGLSKTCSIRVQIPENLETLTDKRLQSEQTYTVSNLMQDPTNNIGITKNSTLIVDLPDYPPTTSQKILNLTTNTTSPQTIYPPSGEYWNSIRYSVNVPIPALNISRYFRIKNIETGVLSSYYRLVKYSSQTTHTIKVNRSYAMVNKKIGEDFTTILFWCDNSIQQTLTLDNEHWFVEIAVSDFGNNPEMMMYEYNGTSQPTDIVLTLKDSDESYLGANYDWVSLVRITEKLRPINIV